MKHKPKVESLCSLICFRIFFPQEGQRLIFRTTGSSFSALRLGPPGRGLRLDGPPRNALLSKAAGGKKRAQPRPTGRGRHQEQGVPLNTGCPFTNTHQGPPLSLATIGPPRQNVRTDGKAEGRRGCQGSWNKGGPESRSTPTTSPALPPTVLKLGKGHAALEWS